jgi:hypothetical protein
MAQKTMPETPPAKAVKKMGWGFWLGWLGGLAAGGAVFALIVSSAYSSNEAIFWAFVLAGGIVGLLQWLVMRQYMRGSWWWFPANPIYTAIVAAAGNSGSYTFAYTLLFGYAILNLIVMPVIISRRRRSS